MVMIQSSLVKALNVGFVAHDAFGYKLEHVDESIHF